jgi:hypothetical protein
MAAFGMLNRKTMLLSASGLQRVWRLSAPKDAACGWLKRGYGQMAIAGKNRRIYICR